MYLKKRQRGYLINHYQNKVGINPERYYFAILLLFKPWRNISELRNGCDTYVEAFSSLQSKLLEAFKYHERLMDLQKSIDHMKELIAEDLNRGTQPSEERNEETSDLLHCRPIETENAMVEFRDFVENIDTMNVTHMISQMNEDQKRIFSRIMKSLLSNNGEVMRLFVSGEGGTGKSFLIKTIRCWVKQVIGKDTAVAAPTGIAAFNIDGLTLHRLFQLPIEYGCAPKYKQLSDQVLQSLRYELRNVVLFIIDEVSMISNVTLLYMHLRLTEIYNTFELENGWFGGKHILFFGDLLQLPPVHEKLIFVQLPTERIERILGSLGCINLWTLFAYDELTINMRQQSDTQYCEILSRIRVGALLDSDSKCLMSRRIEFTSSTCGGRLQELCDYIRKLPVDAVCLLPTCHICDILNTECLRQYRRTKFCLRLKIRWIVHLV